MNCLPPSGSNMQRRPKLCEDLAHLTGLNDCFVELAAKNKRNSDLSEVPATEGICWNTGTESPELSPKALAQSLGSGAERTTECETGLHLGRGAVRSDGVMARHVKYRSTFVSD